MKNILSGSILALFSVAMILSSGCQKEDIFPDAAIPLNIKNATLTSSDMGEPVHFQYVRVRAKPAGSLDYWVWESDLIPEIKYNESADMIINKSIGYCDIQVEIGSTISVATAEVVEFTPIKLNIANQLCVETGTVLKLEAMHGHKL